MHLSKNLVEQFRKLYEQKYGENIKYAVAEYQLKELAELIRIVAKNETLRHE